MSRGAVFATALVLCFSAAVQPSTVKPAENIEPLRNSLRFEGPEFDETAQETNPATSNKIRDTSDRSHSGQKKKAEKVIEMAPRAQCD
eukprot:3548182-Rhodomonas_salina.1